MLPYVIKFPFFDHADLKISIATSEKVNKINTFYDLVITAVSKAKVSKKGSPAAKMQTPDTKKGSTFAEFQRQGAKNGGGIGFNQLGAERGEFAAIHQQKIGNVPKGSDFSKIQRAVYSCDDK